MTNIPRKIRTLLYLLRVYHNLELALQSFASTLPPERQGELPFTKNNWSQRIFAALECVIQSLRESGFCFYEKGAEGATEARSTKQQFLSYLKTLLSLPRPWEAYERKVLEEMVKGLFLNHPTASCLHFIKMELALGRPLSARRLAATLPRGNLKNLAERLARTGVEVQRGRSPQRNFVGSLADPGASAEYPASLPLFRRLIERGEAGYPFAEKILPFLRGAERQEALAWWSLAVFRTRSLEAALHVVRGIRYRSAKDKALFLLVREAVFQGRADDVRPLLPRFSSSFIRERARQALVACAPRRSRGAHDQSESRYDGFSADVFARKIAALSVFTGSWVSRISPEEAFALGALGWAPLRGGRDVSARFPPGSEERAFYDEGLALSPRGYSRRRVLLRAARYALRQAFQDRAPGARPAILSRLRGLSYLGGTPVVEALSALMREITRSSPYLEPIVFTLLTLEPKRVLQLFFSDYVKLSGLGDTLFTLLTDLEKKGLLEQGYTKAFRELKEGLSALLPALYVNSWIGAVLALWWEAFGQPMSPFVLSVLQKRLEENHLFPGTQCGMGDFDCIESAKKAFQIVTEKGEEICKLPSEKFLRALDKEPENIKLLLSLSRRVIYTRGEWNLERWRSAITRLALQSSVVAKGLVFDLSRRLVSGQRGSSLFFDLLAGRNPARPSWEKLPLDEEGRYFIKYLDKKRDFFDFLRFADSVTCCYSSFSSCYRSWMDTQGWLLKVWKDPLSFCFQVILQERENPPVAWGFIFGSYGFEGEQPAVFLNGIYLKKQRPWLRKKILTTIEEKFCSPLGIRVVLIANTNGGRGDLPKDYRLAKGRWLRRLRALQNPSGCLETRIYDDISYMVNACFEAGYGIYRKELPRAEAPRSCTAKRIASTSLG